MTGACSIVSKLYLVAALLELVPAGHFTSVEFGDVFADLMQNFLEQAPALSDGSECLGDVTHRGPGPTGSLDLLHSQGDPSLSDEHGLEVIQ